MLILDATDIIAGQNAQPQIARWIVGDKQYVIEAEEDWLDPRLPKVVVETEGIEIPVQEEPVAPVVPVVRNE